MPVGPDLYGFAFIALTAVLTLAAALGHPSAAKWLTVALISRVAVVCVGHYVAPLPDSGGDAVRFEATALEWSQGGFLAAMGHFTGPDSYFISWILAVLYSIVGQSVLMAQSVSLLFGMATVWMGWLLAKRLWGPRTANKAGWVLALFPTLILNSALILREAYITFFVLVALYGVVGWARLGGHKPLIVALLGFVGATFFHGGMIVGALAFLGVVGLTALRRLLQTFSKSRAHLLSLSLIIVAAIGLGLFVSGAISLPKIGTFQQAIDLERLVTIAERNTQSADASGGAAYPAWLVLNSPAEILYKGPIRVVYLLFAPFPWDIRSPAHLIGLFDGLLYMALLFLIWKNRKIIWADRAMRTIVVVLAAYLVVFGLAVGNFGTGIRHRAKFVGGLIALAAPRIKRLRFSRFFVHRNTPTRVGPAPRGGAIPHQ